MAEHLIRLRGGWRCVPGGGLPETPAVVAGPLITLPVTWSESAGNPVAVRLIRSFTAPSLDPSCERLSLRMSAVGGLVSVQLNGRELARPAPGTAALELPLRDPLPHRNELVLDVRLSGAHASRDIPQPPWGVVALVIHGQQPSGDAGADSGDDSLGEDGPPA
jgi:hypothetical protein